MLEWFFLIRLTSKGNMTNMERKLLAKISVVGGLHNISSTKKNKVKMLLKRITSPSRQECWGRKLSIVPEESRENFQLIFLGDPGVGKTSVISHFLGNDNKTVIETPSSPAYYYKKNLTFGGVEITMNVWDINCSSRFSSTLPFYCRNADAVILMFDLTNELSFFHLDGYFSFVKQHCPRRICPTVVISTKGDLTEERKTTNSEINFFLFKHIKFTNYFEVSTNPKGLKQIENAFNRVIVELIERSQNEEENGESENDSPMTPVNPVINNFNIEILIDKLQHETEMKGNKRSPLFGSCFSCGC